MLPLGNHLLPLLRAASPLPSLTHHRALLPRGLPRRLSTSPAPFSLEDYLVAACGLSPDQARKVSKKAFEEVSKEAKKPFEDFSRSRLNTASNPDAILALLSGAGLSRAEIAAVVAADPLILRSYLKNIGPRLLALRDRLGLSTPQIYQFLLVGSRAFRSCDICPKLEVLISFFGSFERFLVAVKRCSWILTLDLDRLIKPNIQLYRQCGLSDRDIVQVSLNHPMLLGRNPERVKDSVLLAESLGVPRSSAMFKYAVEVSSYLGKEEIASRVDFLKSTLGCSDSEFVIAVSRMPRILGLSKECLLPKIQFLLNEVGLVPRYIVERPTLLGFSLENRLVPRHCVMKLLQEKGLLKRDQNFYALAKCGEKTFRLKFIDCYKDSVPGLAEAYSAATVGGVPLRIQA